MSDKGKKLVLTYEEVGMASQGLQALQQVYMMRAAVEPEAAQRAMDMASVNNHLLAEIGALNRNKDILLAQYGNPQADAQGRTGFLLDKDPKKIVAYEKALTALMESRRWMPFELIPITPMDLQALGARPEVLAMLRPIVVLVPTEQVEAEA